MLSIADLRSIAEGRLEDAEVLFQRTRYDGAVYLCGYAVETALKGRVCTTLNWVGYPSTRNEFTDYRSFQTHNLDVLLRLSGREEEIRKKLITDWSVVVEWNPEARYQPIGTTSKEEARKMMDSAEAIVRAL